MPLLNTSDKIYLGSNVVSKIMLGTNQVWPIFWESFETGSRLTSINGSVIANWDRILDGSDTVMNYNTAANIHSCIWDDANTYSASATFNLEAMVRVEAGGTNLAMVVFGKQAGANLNAYQVCIDRRNLTGGSAAFQIRANNSASVLASSTVPVIATNVWYRISIDWRLSGTRITARLYDNTNTLLATITSNSTTYTSGRVGVQGYNQSSFNNIKLTV